MSKDTISVNMNVYDIPILVEQLKKLEQENKQLKEDLRVSQSNEETYSLEMQEITKILGLDEDTLFDDVKDYAKQLKEELDRCVKANIILDNTNTDYASIIFDLEKWLNKRIKNVPETMAEVFEDEIILDKIQKLKEKYK